MEFRAGFFYTNYIQLFEYSNIQNTHSGKIGPYISDTSKR